MSECVCGSQVIERALCLKQCRFVKVWKVVCARAFVYTYGKYIYIYARAFVCAHIWKVYIHKQGGYGKYICARACVYIYIYARVCVYTYLYARVCIYIYMCTYR